MPLNILRLNARHQHPTPRIVFIKPLPGPSASQAEAFLSRVAAICHPILTNHSISVTTLEEYEPNPEFIGRNFNAGECIQLVLRTRSGGWIPFRSVVMVMMHELAHCKQMNHSRAFWTVRNIYASEMRGLWQKGYTGEGVWGRGRELGGGNFEDKTAEWGGDEMPHSLCGGTYRSRRKRKRGEKVKPSYVEQKQRRIEKKFGKNGMILGDDKEVKHFLEGKKIQGKPRVAGSNRGRELRAQAALVRLDAQKAETAQKAEDVKEESDYEDDDPHAEDAMDINGTKLVDGQGCGMVKVCEGEDVDDIQVKQEMDELQDIWSIQTRTSIRKSPERSKIENSSVTQSSTDDMRQKLAIARKGDKSKIDNIFKKQHSLDTSKSKDEAKLAQSTPKSLASSQDPSTSISCPICSTNNAVSSLACTMCAHVLKPYLAPGSWKCQSIGCKESQYINAADCRACGVCGTKRSDQSIIKIGGASIA
jgi:DNA-dependent metalloprotease WSS1